VKKTFIIAIMAVSLLALHPHLAMAADAFGKAEGSLKSLGLSFQKCLKWVGVFAFLFGAAQYTLGRKQQGKFYMVSAAVGYALVLAVFLIFSLLEGIFSGLL